MKRNFLLTILITLALQINATEINVPIKRDYKEQPDNTHPDRSLLFDFWVTFNTENSTLKIETEDNINSSLYIFDRNNNIITFFEITQPIVDLSYLPNGKYTILIENNYWFATGIFTK